jgi:zinc/manganese transport system permease protein
MTWWLHVFDDAFIRNAFIAGTVVAIVAGVVGYFVVVRGLAFAGHAIAHIGFAGAAGAVVLHLPAAIGLLAFSCGGAAAMGALGNRIRGRDVAIGIVLAWMMGLGVLFLSLYTGYATEAYALLFGQILGISIANLVATAGAALVALGSIVVLYRPLLFASADEEAAEARGVPVRTVGIVFMLVLALAVASAAQVVGVLLIFSLLISPAAIAERLTARPPLAIAIAVGAALAFTWGGLLLAYCWPYPVSFFITSLAFGGYIVVRLVRKGVRRAPVSAHAPRLAETPLHE